MADTLEQADKNLFRMPARYRRMVEAAREAAAEDSDSIMPRKPFRPFIEDDGKPTGTAAKAAPSFELVDCLPDANNREIAYQEMKIDREMWPMVEA